MLNGLRGHGVERACFCALLFDFSVSECWGKLVSCADSLYGCPLPDGMEERLQPLQTMGRGARRLAGLNLNPGCGR